MESTLHSLALLSIGVYCDILEKNITHKVVRARLEQFIYRLGARSVLEGFPDCSRQLWLTGPGANDSPILRETLQ